MDPQQTFVRFVSRVLAPEKAERFTSLSATKKGQRKILDGLCHEFEPAILPAAVRRTDYDALLDKPCFVFYAPMGFGVEFSAVRDAYEKLSVEDSWLILLTDASAGIHRPEGRWDDETLIVA
jgi:hypothetical protein